MVYNPSYKGIINMYWIIAAIILFVAEMFLGSFYLLVVSASLLSAGLAAWLFDTGTTANILIASVSSVIGIVLVRRWQKNRPKNTVDQDGNDLDIGQTVVLEQALPSGLWQVRYRGSLWQAEVDGSAAAGASALIRSKHGNILRVSVVPSVH